MFRSPSGDHTASLWLRSWLYIFRMRSCGIYQILKKILWNWNNSTFKPHRTRRKILQESKPIRIGNLINKYLITSLAIHVSHRKLDAFLQIQDVPWRWWQDPTNLCWCCWMWPSWTGLWRMSGFLKICIIKT